MREAGRLYHAVELHDVPLAEAQAGSLLVRRTL